jgi:hypothetical protein
MIKYNKGYYMAVLMLLILYAFYPMYFASSALGGIFWDGNSFPIVSFILILICPFAYIIVSIINIFYAKKLIKQKNKEKLNKLMRVIKFGSIPFWIINFIILVIAGIFGIVATRGAGIIFLPILVLLTYILFLGTSVFSIAYIKLLYQEGEIVSIHKILHIILQLCFVLDIVDIIYLKIKLNKNKKPNEEKR